MNDILRLRATAAFGLEGMVRGELERMGFEDARGADGGVAFTGTLRDALKANLRLRVADRVLIEAGTFDALTFDDLYEGVKALPWERYLPRDAQIPLSATCARSQLMSPRDVQSITKKAIVDRLCARYRVARLPETGARYRVDAHIHGDVASLTIDTSGAGLSRRGYRTLNGEAPLRETLAAAMIMLSRWRPGDPLLDPMCGTGTIPIEAAMLAEGRAPGLGRAFDVEAWLPAEAVREARSEAEALLRPLPDLRISGSDRDAEALGLARFHIERAGYKDRIVLTQGACEDVRPEVGVHIVCNPPYGERMGGKKDAAAAIRCLKALMEGGAASIALITPDPAAQKALGFKGIKKRRVYNGRLECEILTASNGIR